MAVRAVEATQKRAGVEGGRHVPAASTLPLRRRSREERFPEPLGERGGKRFGKREGGVRKHTGGCDPRLPYARTQTHTHRYKVAIVSAHNVALRHKSCSIGVQNRVETAF